MTMPHFAGNPVGATSWLTGADHHLFLLADDEYADDLEVLPSEGGWLGINPHALVISVVSELPDKQVRLELWDAPPPDPEPGSELQDTCTLTLVSGSIGIGSPAGHDAGIFQVPPGRYQVRLTAWDRTATAREYRDAGERTGFDDTNPEFAAALSRRPACRPGAARSGSGIPAGRERRPL